MALTLVTSSNDGLGRNGGTTTAKNTTGANLIVLIFGGFSTTITSGLISDSKGNTYTVLTNHTGSRQTSVIAYCINPTVGASHDITIGGVGNLYVSVQMLAFACDLATPVFDAENGSSNDSASSLATGSVTPAENGELLIAGAAMEDWGGAGTTVSIDNGFSTVDQISGSSGNWIGSFAAYKVQGTAAAINPTCTWSALPPYVATSIAAFKVASAAPAASPVSMLSLMGVG